MAHPIGCLVATSSGTFHGNDYGIDNDPWDIIFPTGRRTKKRVVCGAKGPWDGSWDVNAHGILTITPGIQ